MVLNEAVDHPSEFVLESVPAWHRPREDSPSPRGLGEPWLVSPTGGPMHGEINVAGSAQNVAGSAQESEKLAASKALLLGLRLLLLKPAIAD